MRSPSAEYLEAAKVEELAADLQQQGYRVVRDAQLGSQQFDLLAERDGQRLAVEVKARSRLTESTADVIRLREAARAAGLSEFRLVVVVPPRVVDVSIENLETEFLRYFADQGVPSNLDELSSETRIENVSDIEVESVSIHPSHIQVRGRATIDVELNFGRDTTTTESLPFTFDVELDSDLKVVAMTELLIDTGDLAD